MSDSHRKTLRFVLLFIVPAVALTIAVYIYALGGRYVSTDNAYVRADVVAVSAEIDGRVARVAVNDNQYVEAGQLLFEIDSEPFRIELAAADAELAAAAQQVEALRAQYRESELDPERRGKISCHINSYT